jgi:DNA-binding NtrC family response regulator
MGRKSILIIDDELLIRDLLYDFFSEKNWSVSVYATGDNALEMLKNKAFDIALIDICKGADDNIDYVRKIKGLYPELPIVVMTAFPSVESAVSALRLKLEDYIIKPFNANKLYKRLEEIITAEQIRTRPVGVTS